MPLRVRRTFFFGNQRFGEGDLVADDDPLVSFAEPNLFEPADAAVGEIIASGYRPGPDPDENDGEEPSSTNDEEPSDEVPDGKIDEILTWVNGGPLEAAAAEGWQDRALRALEVEQAKGDKARSTLVDTLTKAVDAATANQPDDDGEEPSSTNDEEP